MDFIIDAIVEWLKGLLGSFTVRSPILNDFIEYDIDK